LLRCRNRNLDITENDVWSAIGNYCAKSATRVKQIVTVGVTFHKVKDEYEKKYGFWEFGYWERMIGAPYPIRELFEFLSMYDKGELVSPGRRLGVGEFIFLYEAHIEGKDFGDPQRSSRIYAGRVAINAAINAARTLKARLMIHRGKPNVDELVSVIDKMEQLAPMVMDELGFSLTKVDNIEEVEYNQKG